ncbi:PAS domain-containing sensor histidine kinase [Pararhodospirillum photometricum]|uniref:PAS domain-containing sensor histidine kinase n=1 Tax=Pararhodospirillum photometricum TaxID=1084 RepID=UPI0003154EDE|nr:PAS domain-containing sensor histidine kinase [Pararhodospirillum photometricum]
MPHRRKRGWGVILALCAAAVLALFSSVLFLQARAALDRQTERAALVALMVENAVTRSLESAETALLSVGEAVCVRLCAALESDAMIQPWALEELQAVARQGLRFSPHLRQIVVIRARDGLVLLDSAGNGAEWHLSLAALGLPPDGGEGHTAQERSLSRGLMIGEVRAGRTLPVAGQAAAVGLQSVLPVAVRGGPGLIVLGALNPPYFSVILDRAGAGGAAWLARLEGTPILEGNGRAFPSVPGLADLARRDQDEAVIPLSTEEGGPHSLAVRLSQRYPVAVLVSVPHRGALEAWAWESAVLLGVGAAALAGLLVTGVLLGRESLRRGRLEDQVRLLSLTEGVFANAADGMVITDRSGTILSVNPTLALLSGVPETDLLGRSVASLVESVGKVDPTAGVLECRDGERREVELRWAPLGLDSRVLTIHDVAEQRAGERRLVEALRRAEAASRAKSEFLANMSHELRTPLNAIIGFSDMMRSRTLGPLPKPYEEYADLILHSGRHLLETINQILDLAKIEAGKVDLVVEEVALAAVVEDVVALLALQARERGLTLINAVSCPHQVRLDPLRVRQALFNVVGNALKYTLRGRVEMTSRCDAQGHALIVTDTGIGMTPEQISLALQPFERVHGATVARREEGTGLGLSLAERILSLHGGRLDLDSTPGVGTTVTLFLPSGPPGGASPTGEPS